MRHVDVLALALALAFAFALTGCAAEGAGTSNFELTPKAVGWYAGQEARFDLEISASLLRADPTFTIDRRFAIEEINLDERGMSFGGDHDTRDPDSVQLKLMRDGVESNEWTLDESEPSIEVVLTLPQSLKDSEYVLELKVFEVGWVKSEPFRVDRV